MFQLDVKAWGEIVALVMEDTDAADASVMYIQNVHLKLCLYFSDKLLSKRTGILETFVSR